MAIALASEDARYPSEVELHLFRIVQAAVENAFEHGQARSIAVKGRLNSDHVDIEIQDDGNGFDVPSGPALEQLIAHKHFGLAGMLERARLIGGSVRIESTPGSGTRIRAHWNADPREGSPTP